MATTAQQALDRSIFIMGENDEKTGSTSTKDTVEYRVRAIGVINTLLDELYLASDTYTKAISGVRPIAAEITALTDALPIDDALARTVLPYGMAALFQLTNNPREAAFYHARYEELLGRFSRAMPSRSVPITDVYGVCGYTDETYNDFEV